MLKTYDICKMTLSFFSRESNSTITNVHLLVCPSVCLSANPLNSLKSSSFIIQPSSFFIHPSFTIHHSSSFYINPFFILQLLIFSACCQCITGNVCAWWLGACSDVLPSSQEDDRRYRQRSKHGHSKMFGSHK